MVDRSVDWIKQALRDLEQARLSEQAGFFEWACFSAQQAADKAVKGLHLKFRQEAWGHVVARLLSASTFSECTLWVNRKSAGIGWVLYPSPLP